MLTPIVPLAGINLTLSANGVEERGLSPSQIVYADWKALEEQIPVVEWRYEHRNNAQLLLPGLYLGSLQMSRSLPRLRAHHITHVIHACDSRGRALPASLANASTDNGNDNTIQANDAASIQLKVLDIYHQDNHTFAVFNEAVQFCRMAWAQHGNVLIYCLTGIDASAVIATAIVMNMTGMSHTDAMYWVKMRRRCADIRGTYLRLLQEYDPFLYAQHQMAAMSVNSDSSSTSDSSNIDMTNLTTTKRRMETNDHSTEDGTNNHKKRL